MFVWFMLRFRGDLVTESCQCFLNIDRHGEMDFSFFVIPVQTDSNVMRPFPIFFNLVVLPEHLYEMLDMFLVDELNTKIVPNLSETNCGPFVLPVSGCEFFLCVAGLEKALFKELLCNYAGLWESIHTSSYLAVYVYVWVYLFTEVVFFNDIFWEQFKLHLEIFVACHWCFQVDILDVD